MTHKIRKKKTLRKDYDNFERMATTLPKQYAWLYKKKAPRLVVEFVKLYGTKEVPGKKSNPVILQWAKTLGLAKDYTNDGIAWCGLQLAWLCHLCDKPIPVDPLWALNWLSWGIEVLKGEECFGDILVFKRFDAKGKLIGGHVGIYIAEDETHFHVGGGNESDMTNIVRIAKSRLTGCRRPQYVNKPKEAEKIFVDAKGIISDNEA